MIEGRRFHVISGVNIIIVLCNINFQLYSSLPRKFSRFQEFGKSSMSFVLSTYLCMYINLS